MSTRPSLEIAVRASAVLGEGPTWDAAAGRLIWVDILSSRVHGYDPATGRRTTLATEQHVGAAKPRAGGGLVVNLRDGIGVYGADGGFDWLLREPVPGRRGNDAAVAPDGSLWAGTMRYEEAAGGGTLSRVGSDGSPTEILPEVTVSNGIGWSPDGRLMYYIDTPTRRIDVFDVDPDMGRRPVPTARRFRAAGRSPRWKRARASRTGCVWTPTARCGSPCGTAPRSVATPPTGHSIGWWSFRSRARPRVPSAVRTSPICI